MTIRVFRSRIMTSIEALSQAFSKALTLKDSPEANSEFAKIQSELTPLQTAEQHQWLTISLRFPEGVSQLNDTLRFRTFLLDTGSASVADAVVFGRILPLAKKWSGDEIKENRHIARWVDLIQNTLKVEDPVKIDASLEVPRELKQKEKKGNKGDKAEKKGDKGEKKDVKSEGEKEVKEKKDEKEEKVDKEAARKEKKEKKKKEKKPVEAPKERVVTPGMIDLRVGHIVKAIKHPDADSLYVSTIDIGEPEGPRTVCSGLVKHFSLEEMQDRYVVTVANLKPVNMRGVKSQAMVLCANDPADGVVEFVNPPPDSKPGDKIFFEGYDETPEPILNPKKKIWETVQPSFTTNENLEVIYKKEGEPDRKLVNKKSEALKVKSLVNAGVR